MFLADTPAQLLMIMIVVIIILTLLLCSGWMLLYRYFKALRSANIGLIKREQREALLLYELREIKKKNHQLEDKLRKVQHELYYEKQKEGHR